MIWIVGVGALGVGFVVGAMFCAFFTGGKLEEAYRRGVEDASKDQG